MKTDDLLGGTASANTQGSAPVAAWLPIETAPKDVVRSDGRSRYGQWVIVYPAFGRVACARWWFVEGEPVDGHWCNWLMDGGNAVNPTHWMPLPAPPMDEAQDGEEPEAVPPSNA